MYAFYECICSTLPPLPQCNWYIYESFFNLGHNSYYPWDVVCVHIYMNYFLQKIEHFEHIIICFLLFISILFI